MKCVAILAYNNAALFELGCAIELFGLSRPEFEQWYETTVVCFDNSALNVTGGIQITASMVKHFKGYDMLVIPSWPTQNSSVPPDVSRAVLQFAQSGGRIVSFCSGAFLLAELGLLDHRQATTHWRYAQCFKNKYKHVSYIDNVLYVYDGMIGCSAGSAAAIDLGLEIIRRDFGYQAANQVSRRLVMSAHRSGGQSQFVETPILKKPGQFSAAIDWAQNNLAETMNINTLADKANMSRRTFDRRFKEAMDLTPKEWLIQQRLQLARDLLEESKFSIEQVAALSGFENATTLRHNFRKVLNLSPRQYRDQFGKI